MFRCRFCIFLVIISSRVLLPLYTTFFRPNLEYAVHASYTATYRLWKRCIEARSEVCERASACSVRNRSPTASTILPCQPANPCRSNAHGLLKFPIQPAQGYAATHIISINRCFTHHRQHAVPFLNKLPAEIVNASSVESLKSLLEAKWMSLVPNAPI